MLMLNNKSKVGYNYLIENTLNYRMNLANHSFNFLAGHTFQKERISYTSITATGFADDNIQSIAGGSSFTAKHHLDIWTMESYFQEYNMITTPNIYFQRQ